MIILKTDVFQAMNNTPVNIIWSNNNGVIKENYQAK